MSQFCLGWGENKTLEIKVKRFNEPNVEDKLPRAFGMLSELPAFAVHPPCSGHCSRASLHLLTGSSYRLQNRYNRCPQLTEEKQRLGELKPKVPQLINGRMRIPAQHPGPALCLWSSDARIFLLLEISWFPFSQFSHSVVSDSLRPHGLQRARPPCPSPAPRAHSNSCPPSW